MAPQAVNFAIKFPQLFGGGVKKLRKRFWYIFGPFYFNHNFRSLKASSKNFSVVPKFNGNNLN
jgi:hypothetical protein